MRFDVFSVFPEVMQAYLSSSVLGKAQESGRVEIHLHNLRDYAKDRHRTTDDEPYGGGGGMVMKPEPVFTAVESVFGAEFDGARIALLTPQGRLFNQQLAGEFAQESRLGLICGRYEGVDERIRDHLVTDEISIGDFVLTGGELPAMMVIDAVARLLPGVLGDEQAAIHDSHAAGLLEHPHYTRPPVFRGWEVPEVLRSGDHARIDAWRREQSLLRTLNRRPDLLDRADLSREDTKILDALKRSQKGEQDES
jgi:tRNA (guanine37-N1)-methyltransferase